MVNRDPEEGMPAPVTGACIAKRAWHECSSTVEVVAVRGQPVQGCVPETMVRVRVGLRTERHAHGSSSCTVE